MENADWTTEFVILRWIGVGREKEIKEQGQEGQEASKGRKEKQMDTNSHQDLLNHQESPPLNTPNKRKRRKKKFLLAPSNFISQILFLWVIRLIYLIQNVPDLKNIHLNLYKTETSSQSGDLLQEKWNAQVLKDKEYAIAHLMFLEKLRS